MERRKLAHTDLEVSRACMGTMTFGSQTDVDTAAAMVDMCFERGIDFFDTANVYNQGLSEEILGEVLGDRRTAIILASKVCNPMGDPVEYRGLSRDAIRRGIEDSLRRLRTDYLDIYYLHLPDYETPIEESLATLEELRVEGLIHYPATSNYSAWQMCEMLSICEREGWAKPWIAQPMYNLAARGIEQEYLAFTDRCGISNVVYNPLAGGLLTGKQRPEAPLPGTRFDGNRMYLDRFWHDEYFRAVAEVETIAGEANLTPVQLALGWLRAQEGADCIIVGASRIEHLEENLGAFDTPSLDGDVLAACDGVWARLRGPTPAYNR
ncbi:aldo/keto reductase [Candidatus Palauibacter soopunensis]|uniref:aldo/keto reductase n=1 Tax=Candidatus Palauibacter soopunensis TaxID=3056739 RepID=UPI00238A3D93|nr:aldo/keto reductase [Candidatus Palauibacter soopunensis]MDE2878620.1 aldo/keto reductase [Candidatus Palauibacter soopunensis]